MKITPDAMLLLQSPLLDEARAGTVHRCFKKIVAAIWMDCCFSWFKNSGNSCMLPLFEFTFSFEESLRYNLRCTPCFDDFH